MQQLLSSQILISVEATVRESQGGPGSVALYFLLTLIKCVYGFWNCCSAAAAAAKARLLLLLMLSGGSTTHKLLDRKRFYIQV